MQGVICQYAWQGHIRSQWTVIQLHRKPYSPANPEIWDLLSHRASVCASRFSSFTHPYSNSSSMLPMRLNLCDIQKPLTAPALPCSQSSRCQRVPGQASKIGPLCATQFFIGRAIEPFLWQVVGTESTWSDSLQWSEVYGTRSLCSLSLLFYSAKKDLV